MALHRSIRNHVPSRFAAGFTANDVADVRTQIEHNHALGSDERLAWRLFVEEAEAFLARRATRNSAPQIRMGGAAHPMRIPQQPSSTTSNDVRTRGMEASIPPTPPPVQCFICGDDLTGNSVLLPCGHHYDPGCLSSLFSVSLDTDGMFPPRCCRLPVSFTLVRQHLPSSVITKYEQKKQELSTLKRVYCHVPTCSRFLGPLNETPAPPVPIACTAEGCDALTCNTCRDRYNIEDNGDLHMCSPRHEEVTDISSQRHWVACPGCERIVEKTIGCRHIKCSCGTQFCYDCQRKWAECTCRPSHIQAMYRQLQQLGAIRGAGRLFQVPAAPLQPARRPPPAAVRPPPVPPQVNPFFSTPPQSNRATAITSSFAGTVPFNQALGALPVTNVQSTSSAPPIQQQDVAMNDAF